MNLREWSKSEAKYGKKVLDSGLEGVRSAREEVLKGKSLKSFLSEAVRVALKAATVGACLGALSAYPARRNRSIVRILEFGLLGGAIGFGTGLAMEGRELTENAAGAALRNVHKVGDEHWVEKHPVAYA